MAAGAELHVLLSDDFVATAADVNNGTAVIELAVETALLQAGFINDYRGLAAEAFV